MSDALQVEPAALLAAQPAVEAMADQVNAVLARLTAVLDGQGPCWGPDEAGRAFGDAYQPAARGARAGFVRTAVRLVELGDAVGLVAEAAAAANERARQRSS